MADESELITPDGNQKRKSHQFLPNIFKSDSNKKFLAGTLDPLIQSGTVRRLNGYIGRQNSKAVTGKDFYVEEALKNRQDYQLEPCLVGEDNLGNVSFYRDYIDYINSIDVQNGLNYNHQKLNVQEFYSWEPHIDWDKIVNFLQYYWLPHGPEVIPISGTKQLDTTSTFSVELSDEGDNFAFLFTPDGLTRNPDLRLYRGETYRFEINSPDQPFSIKTERIDGEEFRYNIGVSNQAVMDGVIEFTIPLDAPDTLFYVSENNIDTSGIFKIFDIEDNSSIDVDEEIVGKKNYILKNGISLSNGMKIRFRGKVIPESYLDENFYVEGVGDAIQLIAEKNLEVVSKYANYVDVNYDSIGFDELPFNNINYAALTKDYITINRSSRDRNSWSRYNRWIHQDVIIKTAQILGKQPVFDQSQRAIRPIIEFNPNLKLYNFGTKSKKNIDLLDDFTKDVFSIIEGSLGYNIDNIPLLNGHRVVFTAEEDVRVRNKIYRVEFLDIYDEDTGTTQRKIHLAEESDAEPNVEETILVLGGDKYSGEMFWFNGTTWLQAQSKQGVNQAPLFDLFDLEGVSLTDNSKYEGTTFKGNKIFSYKIGSGTSDKELGFSLSYQSINNIGDIVFAFDLLNSSFSYKKELSIIEESTDNKFLLKNNSVGVPRFLNGWTKNELKNVQPIVRIFKNEFKQTGKESKLITNYFPIDVFDDKTKLDDLKIKVYINGKRLDKSKFQIIDGSVYKEVLLEDFTDENDVVTLKIYSKESKNDKGYYEFPISFQNNSQNNNINEFTLGEVIDHVDSIIDNLETFEGLYPGASNLRDIAKLSSFGTKFIQHSGPLNLSLYHFTDDNINIFKALDKSKEDYGKFKRAFLQNTTYLDDNLSIKDSVDIILQNLNQGKPKLVSYYLSDMLGYGAYIKNEFTVKDTRTKKYPLTKIFTLKELSIRAVNIYINGNQLIHGCDYVFTDDGFIEILAKFNDSDLIEIYEYESTDGCYIPITPTKLGLYPKFEPRKYLDTTLVEPQNVIQGHDGSIMLAYNDYRDDVILELEKRIFNNIKIEYDPKIFDIFDYIPSANRPTDYSLSEFNEILAPNFFKWTTLIETDFTKQLLFLSSNPFTYNYSEVASIDNTQLAGFWRGIYKWYFDTDRIHICPWESLGFTIKPKWWDDVYGSAPYTSDNLILWEDLKNGIVREPNKVPIKNYKFVRPILDNIPVDESGNIIDPIAANIATGLFSVKTDKGYVFGDQGPVETAWRRSSYYPFAIIKAILLMNPNKTMGICFDRSRIYRNIAGQLVYKPTGLRIKLQDLLVPSVSSDDNRIQTSGLVNYILDYLVRDNLFLLEQYKNNLKTLTNKLSHRVAGFTSKEKFNLILESKSASASAGVFIPQENYKIFLNKSSPIKKVFYSGVVITKLLTRYGLGYEVKGYNQTQPFFYYYNWNKIGNLINVGGVSESFILWESGQRYIAGNIVKLNEYYYRVKVSHTSSDQPSYDLLQQLNQVPIVGGQDAYIRKSFDRVPIMLNYGTILTSIQEVVDFLLGYGEYLTDQGFIFDNFNKELKNVTNWEYSVKEFLFWTTQNWSSGADFYTEWNPNTKYQLDNVVYYNGEFYKVSGDHISGNDFDENLYYQINDLNLNGAGAISLSPSALRLDLKLDYSVVDNLTEQTNEYEIFLADGTKYDFNDLNYLRYDNTFSLVPKNGQGIYGASLYLVQREHVLLLDNVTQFNDTVYNLETGYRQERIKVSGYKTIDWNGSFDAPGFIYDRAFIKEWNEWVDYNLGDIVKYKEFYYTAKNPIIGKDTFDNTEWTRLSTRPESELLPNWDYKSLQFTDFYDLDSDNFDVNQQRVAQHFIGYQKRQYLNNIIQNDVSEFKFYQGMITEKGTFNSLNKLFDVLSSADKDSIDFIEEWAVRTGQYGASDAFEEVEFILDESLFKVDPQNFELVSTIDNSKTDYVIRQTKNDIYLKPRNYQNNIWPINENFDPLLKTPGFVRLDHVKYAIDKKLDILNIDIKTLSNGDYIWCAFESKINQFGDDWNIYRFSNLDINIVSTTSNSITFDVNPNLVVNDIIGFKSNVINFNLFVKVLAVNGKTVNVGTLSTAITGGADLSEVLVYKITDQRYTNIDQLQVPKFLNPTSTSWKYGELVWFSDTNQEIWQNIPIYNRTSLTDTALVEESYYGSTTVINKTASLMLVSTLGDSKKVFVYKKPYGITYWIKEQVIELDLETQLTGLKLSASDDEKYIAISGLNENRNGVVLIYELADTGEYDYSTTIVNPEEISDEFFGFKIKFALFEETYYIYISSTDSISISGKVYVFTYDTDWTLYDTIGPLDDCNEEPFAYCFDITEDGSTLAVSSCLNEGGKVFIYHRDTVNNTYVRSNYVLALAGNNEERFGFDIALSSAGNLLAISSTLEDVTYLNQGRVYVYKRNINDDYDLVQVIDNRNAEQDEVIGEQYGYRVKFANEEKTLVIYSKYGDSSNTSILGEDSTRLNLDTGRVDIYDIYMTKFIFSESLAVKNNYEGYGSSFDVADNTVVIGASLSNGAAGQMYIYTKPANEFSWKLYLTEQPKVDINTFKKILIYDRKYRNLISYLDIIDPIQGKIAGVADIEIKFKTYYDPAIYTQKSNSLNLNVDQGMAWLDDQVGLLWWDLRRAKFVDPIMGDVVYRNATWNTLYPTASINVYEWVSSPYSPEVWDELTDTEEGLSLGLSGRTLYGMNAYSTKKTYDNVSKSYTTTYYFWVQNKKTIPNKMHRKFSAIDVASYIEDPKSYGLKFIEFLDLNAFSLANVRKNIVDKNVVLSIQYWTVPNKEKQNIHTEWKIISENEKTELPKNLERKWLDSLIGFDEIGKAVPDINLSPKQKYGIEFKPRQGMFINRIEALKQVIERFNYELRKLQIDNIDISDLMQYDEMPKDISGRYDYVRDTDQEIKFVITDNYRVPVLVPVILNGRIIDVNIVAPGAGYKNSPKIEIKGSGINAEIKAIINEYGSITGIDILNSGKGYDDSTTLSVRPLTVLVKSDTSTLGYWALYSYDILKSNWTRSKTQEYDVTKFWSYIDWYASGYNQFVKIDHVITDLYELFTLPVTIGQVVKILNIGASDQWILLEKYSDIESVDYTKTYKVVGKQNGTIQISDNFYNFSNNRLGYDGALYDSNLYDNIGTKELRIILESFKNKLLIDDRRIIYLNLFFVSLKYAFTEQPLIDWAFKTSFIKALHNLGPLVQKVTYSNDNLSDFEKYIKEVKPYRTKIREFVSIYNNLDYSQSLITDFDLPAYVDNNQITTLYTEYKNGQILVNNNSIIGQYPWVSWKQGLGFNVSDIIITDQGDEYISKPLIKFEGECIRPAKAMPYIVRGKLVKIEITDQGEGYYFPPKIIIDGNVSRTGRSAKAYAVIGNGVVRSTKIEMKFDRYNKESMTDIQSFFVTDQFEGDGGTISFDLRYSPITTNNSIVVKVDNQELVLGSYQVLKNYNTDRGHKVHYGTIVFNDAPANDSIISVEYYKDFVHLNALERIKYYYTPESGMLGKDFAQLMTGIDYGGVSITGLGFEKPNSWDGEYAWGDRAWDEGAPTDSELFDTIIDGGNLHPNSAYRTASGLRADDIIIDGDGFITPMTSPAPEEMLPGHVVDSLAIKIFERELSSGGDIVTNVYFGDGVENKFKVQQYPNNKEAIIVKLNDDILSSASDYIFDYDTLTVELIDTPPVNSLIAITSLGFNGENILEIGSHVVTEPTNEIVVNATFSEDIKAFTLVSGEIKNSTIFKTDNNYSRANLIGIRFPFELSVGQVVNYSLFLGNEINQSIVSREIVKTTGLTKRYFLQNLVGEKIPWSPNVIVRLGNTILNSVDSFKYILKNQQLTYDIPLGKANIDLYSLNDYTVYIDGIKVDLSSAYTLDLINSKISIKSNYYKTNSEVVVTITKDADYVIGRLNGKSYIDFKINHPPNTEFEIVSMYNHDILGIERNFYKVETNLKNFTNSIFYLNLIQVSAGIFRFDRKVTNTSYVWVTKNKKLLVPNIDYILLEDKQSVRLAVPPTFNDVCSVITFSGNVSRDPISFMQFKDMMNRFYYKRLHKNRTTELDQALLQGDKEIILKDSSKVGEPNKDSNSPGVVYIEGERIEYFVKIGNRLGQLRRGTLGTGVPNKHEKGVIVHDIGSAETIPYKDETIIWTKNDVNFDDSTNTISLPFVPTKDNIEVFAGTRRLRKDSYVLHDRNIHPESPDGDVEHPAEFIADGINHGTNDNRVGYLVLNEEMPEGLPVTVVLKKLTLWADSNKSLSESENSIAYFLKYNVTPIAGTELTLDSGSYSSDSDDISVDEE